MNLTARNAKWMNVKSNGWNFLLLLRAEHFLGLLHLELSDTLISTLTLSLFFLGISLALPRHCRVTQFLLGWVPLLPTLGLAAFFQTQGSSEISSFLFPNHNANIPSEFGKAWGIVIMRFFFFFSLGCIPLQLPPFGSCSLLQHSCTSSSLLFSHFNT